MSSMQSALWIILFTGLFFMQCKSKQAEPVNTMVAVTSLTNYNGSPLLAGFPESVKPFYVSSNDSNQTTLLAIRDSKDATNDIIEKLKKATGFIRIEKAGFSNPVQKEDIPPFRQLLVHAGLDAREVADDTLVLYATSVFDKQYIYYPDVNRRHAQSPLAPFRIRSIKDHPDYKPEWENRGYTKGTGKDPEGIEVREVIVETIQEEVPPPPPPPPPPKKLKVMTDAQVKSWFKKQYRFLKDEQIHLVRSADSLKIIAMFGENPSTIIYSLR
jgi:hypothetical protein